MEARGYTKFTLTGRDLRGVAHLSVLDHMLSRLFACDAHIAWRWDQDHPSAVGAWDTVIIFEFDRTKKDVVMQIIEEEGERIR